ncbi:MAG: PTS lactose/cellobiose transporter subunit IIA [Bombilactobacillus mellifer]|nr:PTS lactose/cellobiose transporter subunit IIA [Bombilactobacillus mellifer]
MATKEEISMAGFEIVAYAGDAKTALIQALNSAQNGKFDEAQNLIKKANESLVEAHNVQTKLMSKEANGEEMETTFIMSHGQDTLMTTMLLKDIISYFIDLYQKNLELQKEIADLKR